MKVECVKINIIYTVCGMKKITYYLTDRTHRCVTQMLRNNKMNTVNRFNTTKVLLVITDTQ